MNTKESPCGNCPLSERFRSVSSLLRTATRISAERTISQEDPKTKLRTALSIIIHEHIGQNIPWAVFQFIMKDLREVADSHPRSEKCCDPFRVSCVRIFWVGQMVKMYQSIWDEVLFDEDAFLARCERERLAKRMSLVNYGTLLPDKFA